MTPEVTPAIKGLFDLWYRFVPEEPADVTQNQADLLTRLIHPLLNAPILDLGCGTGRHLRVLARSGHTCLQGVDFSETAIAVARQRDYTDCAVRYACEDFRAFLAGHPAQFDVVYSFDCTLTLYPSQQLRRYLERIYASLTRGGHCLLEVWSDAAVLSGNALNCERDYAVEDGILHYRASCDRTASRLFFRHELTRHDGTRIRFPEQVQYVYGRDELRRLARDAGFTRFSCHGDASALTTCVLLVRSR